MQLKAPQRHVIYDIDGSLLDRAYAGNRLAVVALAQDASALLAQLFILPDEILEELLEALNKLDAYGTDPDRAFGWARNIKGRPARTEPSESQRRAMLVARAGVLSQSIRHAAVDDLAPLEWAASVLEKIAAGASPNIAMSWGRSSSGRPISESPFLATIVRQEVAWLMRHGLSKASASVLVGDGIDSLPLAVRDLIHDSDELTVYLNRNGHRAPLSSKRIEEICAELDPWVDQEPDYFPIQ